MIVRIAKRAMWLAALIPLAGVAGEVPGIEDCVQKFTAKRLPAGTKVHIEQSPEIERWSVREGPLVRVSFDVIGADTGKHYGSARCVFDRRGDLVSVYSIARASE